MGKVNLESPVFFYNNDYLINQNEEEKGGVEYDARRGNLWSGKRICYMVEGKNFIEIF